MMPEIPPRLQGSPEQQLAAMRDYLVRLAQSLEQVGRSSTAPADPKNSAAAGVQEKTAAQVKSTARALKALIIKTADEITAYTDSKAESFESLYVAKSDYGNYYNQIETQVAQTARSTVESYHYTEAFGEMNAYLTDLGGQIRRGVIEDPETHEVHLGIAISERLSFTGQTQTEGGLTYYELAPGQTLGLYTARGWQFWIGGVRRGWFSSEDSMLHLSNIVVENRLQLGGEWDVTVTNGFGLRYIGG